MPYLLDPQCWRYLCDKHEAMAVDVLLLANHCSSTLGLVLPGNGSARTRLHREAKDRRAGPLFSLLTCFTLSIFRPLQLCWPNQQHALTKPIYNTRWLTGLGSS
jgi:hypothetical protein